MQRRFLIAGLVAALLVIAAGLWLALRPGWAVGLVQAEAQRFGRVIEVKGGAHLEFSPLAIRLDGVRLSGATPDGDGLMSAESLVIPVSFGNLIGRGVSLSGATLVKPEFALLIDDQGTASWALPAAARFNDFAVTIRNGSLRFYDARNTQALAASDINGILSGDQSGGLTLKATAAVGGRLVDVDAGLKSLARVHADGSPFDLAVESHDLSLSFSGRLATAKVLSLAGQISALGPDLREAARWAGAFNGSAPDAYGAFSVDGILDGVGRALAIRQGVFGLGLFRGGGQMVIDFRGPVPKLQAELQSPSLALDSFLPSAGRSDGQWGKADLGFKALRGFDAEITLETPALRYGAAENIPARIAATLKDGKLDAGVALRTANAGTATVTASIDAKALSPAMTLAVKSEGGDLGLLLRALTGLDLIDGSGTLDLSLAGSGNSEEEIVSTLKGSARLDMAGGTLKFANAASLPAAVADKIAEGWTSLPGTTAFTALSGNAEIVDGIAAVKDLQVKTDSASLAVSGEADLLRRGLDLKVAMTTPAFPVPVAVKGPWGAPRLYPDIDGILTDPAAAFAKLKAMTAAGN